MPWETVGNEIRHRIKDPEDFQKDSFRRITLKASKPRVYAVIGKLKGESTTTVQSLRFPIDDGWTIATAKEWTKENFQKTTRDVGKEHKTFAFDVKVVDEATGVFEGVLSVYNIVDLGGDLVEPGAFTKTLKDNKYQVPFWREHNEPIGMLELTDTGEALTVKGTVVMEVQRARETLALMKAGVMKGMSIGYRTVKSAMKDGVRHLVEVALYEGSVVSFPMLPEAQITSVKAQKDSFDQVLARARAMTERYMIMNACYSALDSICYDEADDLQKIKESEESIDRFKQAYMDALPRYLAVIHDEDPEMVMNTKVGRTLSAFTRAKIEEAIEVLTALLGEEETTSSEAEDEAGKSAPEAAQQQAIEPEPVPVGASSADQDSVHSLVIEQLKSLKGELPKWNRMLN